MKREELERIRDDLRAEGQRIRDLIQKVEDAKMEARTEIVAINESLPQVLADSFVGEVPKPKVTQLKRRRAELEDFFKVDAGLIIGIFERDLKRIINQGDKLSMRYERPLNAYDELKKKILTDPNGRLSGRQKDHLLVMARNPDLDCLADAEKFLADLKNGERVK